MKTLSREINQKGSYQLQDNLGRTYQFQNNQGKLTDIMLFQMTFQFCLKMKGSHSIRDVKIIWALWF